MLLLLREAIAVDVDKHQFKKSPDEAIAKQAVMLQKYHRIELTNAIIWASVQVNFMLLVTRNTKDSNKNEVGVRVPYKI